MLKNNLFSTQYLKVKNFQTLNALQCGAISKHYFQLLWLSAKITTSTWSYFNGSYTVWDRYLFTPNFKHTCAFNSHENWILWELKSMGIQYTRSLCCKLHTLDLTIYDECNNGAKKIFPLCYMSNFSIFTT